MNQRKTGSLGVPFFHSLNMENPMRLFVSSLLLAVAVFCSAFAGETIRVVGVNHPWTDAMKTLLPAFEKETGITVQLETYGEDQLVQKLMVELLAGNSSIDAFVTRPLMEGRVMKQNGWYEDLEPYYLGDKEYDFADYTAGSLECTRVGGAQVAIPLQTEVEVLYYRTDLFEKHGLKPPKTLDEMRAIAAKLTDRANGMFGFVARGQRSALISQFSSYVYNHGSDWFDKKTRRSLLNTPEFIAAAKFYGGMLRDYGPDGVQNMSWPQAVAIFAQGKAAMYTEASSLYPNMLDPAKSTVADKTACAMLPAGPIGHKTYDITSWGLSIYSGSKKKDAAWKFIRYMTDKERTLIIQGDFANQCARKSTYTKPEGIKKFPPTLVEAIFASAPYGVGTTLPPVVAVGEARDIIGEIVATAITGGDVEAAAKTADQKFQALLDKEGK